MVYNYKKQRSPIVPMYTILASTDGVLEKNAGDPRAAKQQIRKIEDTPAPNSYSLPHMGKAPCYSMTGRPRYGRGTYYEAPGPGTHNTTHPDVFKNRAPLYSLQDRTLLPRDDRFKQAPNAYSPENVTITRKASPEYSFGIRHSLPRAPIIVDKQE